MGQKLSSLWRRVQGKQQLRQICDKVFDSFAERNETSGLALKDLHLATLIVFNDVNKHFPGHHKEPPSQEQLKLIETQHSATSPTLNRDEFYQLMLKCVSKDLLVLLAIKIIISLIAAPALVGMTKDVGSRVPQIRDVVEKIPTPVIYSAYTIGFVILQDVRVPSAN